MSNYDLIGDIHGEADALEALLKKLGYRQRHGCYRHPERQVIFLGDFIDRGPRQRGVIDLVRPMVEAGVAQAVMGNHEFNALAYHTPDPAAPGEYLRRHTDKNVKQHKEFVADYAGRPGELAEVLAWFWSLPLWLELDGLRVVHAAWHPESMRVLEGRLTADRRLPESLLEEASREGAPAFLAVETLLKGVEAPLPGGLFFHDTDRTERRRARLRWWLQSAEATWRDLAIVPDLNACPLPNTPLPADIECGYAVDAPPVFMGHYWMTGVPAPVAPNVACVDYSVAKPGGKLVAYRWEGEPVLKKDRFHWVERVE